jgi:ribulose-bisphosphate carboxylase large chain
VARIRATYRIETALAPEKAAQTLAGEQSSGTFVRVPGETDELRERFGARVERVDVLGSSAAPSLPGARTPKEDGRYTRAEIELSWSLENMGPNLPVLLSTVAGNTFDLSAFSGIRLVRLSLPPELVSAYKGPAFGVDGTRRLTNVHGRPIVGTIIKPCIGLTPEQTAERVDELASAGVDFVKDDELLCDNGQSPFDRRVASVMEVVRRHADASGKKLMFAFNVSGDIDDMLRRHDTVLAHGGTCIMVNLLSVGLSGLAKLARHSALPIHGHRCGFGALSRHPALGFDFAAYLALWRLVGVDQVHTNGLSNKFCESDESVIESVRACLLPDDDGRRVLPVMGSGAWAGLAHATYAALGTTDLLFLCGGGILGHPDGLRAGVASVRQAWDAALSGVSLEEQAELHAELGRALTYYG